MALVLSVGHSCFTVNGTKDPSTRENQADTKSLRSDIRAISARLCAKHDGETKSPAPGGPAQFSFTIPGGCQVPSPGGKIEGGVSLGQYRRITTYMAPTGAGSQLDSLSLPGESFCI